MSTSPQTPESNQQLTTENASQRRESESTTSSSELTSVTLKLRKALRNFPDFPIPGIDFVDILPLFASHDLHESLIRALELQVLLVNGGKKPDVIVGLDARGFLFGPSLALRLGAGFAPVRKRGKLPGPTEEAIFDKEYGQDYFQIQKDAIKPGQSVLVVDDIIATGGSAQAAGKLVEKLGGNCMGYLFILELDFLKGRDKLNALVATLLRD
ncbi:adenine phosphoribosyltransferase [Sclerotinia borealis F-4128]|uniref:adenine phosphoribosyltransferase n=1 Tax=Sclerotinia borealis (strain F-4128) TaxID=1432307 RepID=W9CW32_SCLBF|nr:adenine phosphoribosyltransferase [Sclerotinia borealis F-4128]